MNQECSELSYLTQNSIDALDCQAVSDTEWVLVFARKSPVIRLTAFLPVLFPPNPDSSLGFSFFFFFLSFFVTLSLNVLDYGVYVDCNGRRSRQQELQFPTQPLYTATLTTPLASGPPKLLLLAFSAGHIDVFDLQTTHWIQTINLKCTKPLESHGESTLLCLNAASDLPILVCIVPSGRKDLLLKVSGDPNKPFVTSSVSGAQRLIQSAAGAVIDRPVKVLK